MQEQSRVLWKKKIKKKEKKTQRARLVLPAANHIQDKNHVARTRDQGNFNCQPWIDLSSQTFKKNTSARM